MGIEYTVDSHLAETVKNVINHMIHKYPLPETHRLAIQCAQTTAEKTWGQWSAVTLHSPARRQVSFIKIKMAAHSEVQELVTTLTHEFCHVLQGVKYGDQPSKRESKLREIHANLFAIRETAEYLGVPYETIYQEDYPRFYPQTQEYCAQTPKDQWYTNLPAL